LPISSSKLFCICQPVLNSAKLKFSRFGQNSQSGHQTKKIQSPNFSQKEFSEMILYLIRFQNSEKNYFRGGVFEKFSSSVTSRPDSF